MESIAVLLKIDGERVAETLQGAREKLNGGDRELVLDFSSVRRMLPHVFNEMETLASTADEKGVKVALRGVNVDIYKVLKLGKLASRFSFLN